MVLDPLTLPDSVEHEDIIVRERMGGGVFLLFVGGDGQA